MHTNCLIKFLSDVLLAFFKNSIFHTIWQMLPTNIFIWIPFLQLKMNCCLLWIAPILWTWFLVSFDYILLENVYIFPKKKKNLWLIFSGFRYIIHCRQKYGLPLPSPVIRVSIWLFFLIPLTQCMFSFVKEKVSCIAYRLKILLIWFRKHWENVIYHLKFVQSIYSLLKFVRKNSDSWVSTEGVANCSRTALSSISWLWISIFSVNRKDVVSLPNGVFAHAYLYGKRFVGPITSTIRSLRKELYMVPYHEIDWNEARNLCAKISKNYTFFSPLSFLHLTFTLPYYNIFYSFFKLLLLHSKIIQIIGFKDTSK